MIRSDHALAFTYTRVVTRFVRAAHAFVASDGWVGTNGPCSGDTCRLSSSRLILRGDDFRGRTASLYPALQYGLDTVLAVGVRVWNRAKHGCTGTASAMLHSRDHVHPHKLTGTSIAYFCRDVLVVIDGAERRDVGIAPAVIEDQLAARIFERLEICIRGIAYLPKFIVQKRDIAV